jgi:hypothetical protein
LIWVEITFVMSKLNPVTGMCSCTVAIITTLI